MVPEQLLHFMETPPSVRNALHCRIAVVDARLKPPFPHLPDLLTPGPWEDELERLAGR
jgi:hypothetical protein